MLWTVPVSSNSTLTTSINTNGRYIGSGDILPPEPSCLPWLEQHPVVVGLSGGRDSVALLRVLHTSGYEVHACHVHHGIRGGEADADAAFCAALCRELGVQLHSEQVDVPALAAERGTSLETTARVERRRILRQFALSIPAAVVALAHHADDQAETVLFRMARGAAGMRGMRAVHCAEDVVWLRPLLSHTRAEITEWMTTHGYAWRDDATNAVPDVTRNRLRLEVLPALNRAMGRNVVPVLNRSARLQQETLEALETALSRLPLTDPQGRLYLPALYDSSAAFRKAVLRRYLLQHGVPEVSEAMVLAVDAMLPPDSPCARMDLPGGFRAVRRQKRLTIRQQSEQ